MAEKGLTVSKDNNILLKSIGSKKQKSFLSEVRGKRCFVFDFGDYATKLAIARITDGRIDVKNMFVIDNSPQKPKLEASTVKDWRAAIMRVLNVNSISTLGQVAMCTVNSRHYISRQFDIPYTNEEDRQGLVSFEMSQNLSLDVDSYLFQHKVLRTYESNGVKMCTVWAAALQNSQCEIYYNLMDSLKLRPLVMDVNVNGIERIFAADSSLRAATEHAVVATIDLGINGTEVSIFEDGVFSQGANVDIGDGRLVMAARQALGSRAVDIHNNNKLVVDPQTVYNILRQTDESENAKLFRSSVEEWLSAINTVIKRYNISYPNNRITQIFLYGGSKQLSWLKVYVEKYMNIPTKIIQTLDCCRIPNKMLKAGNTVPQFLNALSLLLSK